MGVASDIKTRASLQIAQMLRFTGGGATLLSPAQGKA